MRGLEAKPGSANRIEGHRIGGWDGRPESLLGQHIEWVDPQGPPVESAGPGGDRQTAPGPRRRRLQHAAGKPLGNLEGLDPARANASRRVEEEQ